MHIGKWLTHPAADLMPMAEGKDFEELCYSIRNGFDPEHPILRCKGLVLDGRNRLKACLKFDIKPVFKDIEVDNPFEYVWSHNVARRHLDAGQRAMLRLKFDEEIQRHIERAKTAQDQSRRGGKFAPTAESAAGGASREERKSKTKLAKAASISPRSAQKALTVKQKSPDLADKVERGEMKLDAAYRHLKRDEAIEQLKAEPTPLPDGQFRVIVADPPWPYEVRNDDATHRGAIPYHAMSIDEIMLMPVHERSHEDSILWLWTTNAFLEDAYAVLGAWGFEPKTVLTWDKGRIGAGNWLRNQTEHCIVAVRGKPTVNLTNQSTLLQAPASRQHSAKPDEFYALVESLCPGSKLELFARKARPGWTAWGSEVDGIVQRDEIQAPELVVERDPDVDALGVPGEMLIDERGMPDDEWMGRPAGGTR